MKKRSEARLSQDCATWLWNHYPKHRGLYCLNLNNTGIHVTIEMVQSWLPKGAWGLAPIIVRRIEELNRRIANINKSSGLIAGRSDATLHLVGNNIHFEYKLEKGRQSDSQKEWESVVNGINNKYYIIRSLEEFQKIVKLFI